MNQTNVIKGKGRNNEIEYLEINMNDKVKFLGVTANSSANPNNLSASIGGLSIVGLSQVLSFLFGLLGVSVEESELTAAITSIVGGIGGVMFVYGVARRLYLTKFKKTDIVP